MVCLCLVCFRIWKLSHHSLNKIVQLSWNFWIDKNININQYLNYVGETLASASSDFDLDYLGSLSQSEP